MNREQLENTSLSLLNEEKKEEELALRISRTRQRDVLTEIPNLLPLKLEEDR